MTIELKLSSIRVMAAASRATSVPAIPIANPTSAFLSAGASLVPSPVTATTLPLSLRPVTRAYLSSGLDLARTSKLSLILSNSSPLAMVSTLSSVPSSSAFLLVVGQGQTKVLHLEQTTPPTNLLKSGPSMAMKSFPSSMMPTSLAIALAVMMLSPVTIRTVMPAPWHFRMAPGTSFLGSSRTPMIAKRVILAF